MVSSEKFVSFSSVEHPHAFLDGFFSVFSFGVVTSPKLKDYNIGKYFYFATNNIICSYKKLRTYSPFMRKNNYEKN